MTLRRVRIPIGVIGIIYGSRPNVTADAAALCMKAGNAVILRGGSEALESNRALHAVLAEALAGAGLPAHAVQLVPTTRSEDHTSELQSLLRISYAVFCLQKKKPLQHYHHPLI